MTVKDLKKLLEDKNDDVVVVFKDRNGGWCNLQNAVDSYPCELALLEADNPLFDDE